jgi:hypothetical protein
VAWQGLPALERDLAGLPLALVQASAPVLAAWGNRTAAAIGAAYPVGQYRGGRTGGMLRARVQSRLEYGSAYGVRAKVVSAAPHSHLYERGSYKSGDRWTSRRGRWFRGRMPAHPTFVPMMQAARRELRPVLADLLRSFGLEVRDDG